ncbi:SDR family oxidoreductase [Vampirovibrio chlorellavorus]|uniref:SDR family oxidoreductase n=1 Tax=Vampirovibrio chlorellavorus TaxID=758823 RepID=UPI0026EB8A5D|nr:SDR family oxidoreductase [Vampirovibrio chlorellavorus]
MQPNEQTILVLGATGYVGGRLVPRLLEAGYRVRAASRSIRKLESRSWGHHPLVELAAVDVTDLASLTGAVQGCTVAYYLVHSMDPSNQDFSEADRQAAANMVQAARDGGLSRIIYLSGLGHDDGDLSKHLKSRTEVAHILSEGPIPVTVLRAAMIIGSGSASFEILRYLVDRLPVMITPKWLSTPCQPIAIRNVLNYLLGCLQHPETTGQTYDIGGEDILTYRQLMEIYSEEARLGHRWIIPIPFFTPTLSSYWIHLVTPVSASIARPLAEGLRNPVVCGESRIREIIPQDLLSVREAIHLALDNIVRQSVESHWTDAGYLPPVETRYPGDPDWSGGTLFKDRRVIRVEGCIDDLWHAIVRIGGENGWYYGNWLWSIRGLLDKLFGGVGSYRGRRDPERVYPGDALDFWRVLNVDEPKRLRLLAEMKVPGLAVLEFLITPLENGQLELAQTAWFAPRGLGGLLYWYAVAPLHNLVFNGMLRGIAKASHRPLLQGPLRTH